VSETLTPHSFILSSDAFGQTPRYVLEYRDVQIDYATGSAKMRAATWGESGVFVPAVGTPQRSEGETGQPWERICLVQLPYL
jgi:hypothetical protein